MFQVTPNESIIDSGPRAKEGKLENFPRRTEFDRVFCDKLATNKDRSFVNEEGREVFGKDVYE